MTFQFRPAVRENVGLLIGLAGGTGSGKTYSAMRLAAGIAGEKRFAVIDTEAGRAKHYADEFKFDHGDLKAPFTPDAYEEAIKAADSAGYPVIVVDSFSHEHAGEGGLLDMQEVELTRMAGDNWTKRDACKMASWIKPKTEHKAMVNKLLQVRAHLILCFRAEEKIEMVRDENGKMRAVPKKSRTGKDGWIPICEKSLPFEMTCSFLLLMDKPGFPNAIKLEEQHRHLFPETKPIDEASGRGVAAWASGVRKKTAVAGAGTVTTLVQGKEEPKKTTENIPASGDADYEAAVRARVELVALAEVTAKGGFKELSRWYRETITQVQRDSLTPDKERLIALARESDETAALL